MQGKTETIDQYVTDLKIIFKKYKFGALEGEMLRDRIVCGFYAEKVFFFFFFFLHRSSECCSACQKCFSVHQQFRQGVYL